MSKEIKSRCDCGGKLELDDDYEDIELVGGRIELALVCSKCDTDYTGTFVLESLDKEDDEDE